MITSCKLKGSVDVVDASRHYIQMSSQKPEYIRD